MLALATSAWAPAATPPAKPAPRTAQPASRSSRPNRRRPKSPFTPPAFKITVATEGAYPPFNYLDRKGLPAGFEMELAQDACQRMKAECEFIAAKWDELVPGLLDKKFDIVMSSIEVNNERRRAARDVAALLSLARRLHRRQGPAVRRAAVTVAQQEDRRAEELDHADGSTRASAVRRRSSAIPRWQRH